MTSLTHDLGRTHPPLSLIRLPPKRPHKSTPKAATKPAEKAAPQKPTIHAAKPPAQKVAPQKPLQGSAERPLPLLLTSQQDKKARIPAKKLTAVNLSEVEHLKVAAALLDDVDGEASRRKLVGNYPLKAKTLEFRNRFDKLIGKSYVWVPKIPDSFHEMLSVLSQTVAFLGFEEAAIQSSHSAKYTSLACPGEPSSNGELELRDSRLSLLWIRPPEYAWTQLNNFLVYRQVDAQHESIINKWLLIANLKSHDQLNKLKTLSGAAFKSDRFLPETISLDMQLDKMISLMATFHGTYIIKNVRGTKGQNMSLLRLASKDHIGGGNNAAGQPHRELMELLKAANLLDQRLSDLIMQRYIEHPLLVDKRKFDFRVYMLMVNACRKDASSDGVKKAFYVYCHPGFLRLCILAYSRDSGDLLGHLTNQHVQMKSVLYDQFKEATVWEPDELNNYFNTKGGLPACNYVRDVIYPKIGVITGYLGAVFADSLTDSIIQASTFKIFGVDFLVDSRLNVHLLEVNEMPSWKRQTKVLAQLKSDIWREATGLASETVIRFRLGETLQQPLLSQCNFRLVHSSEEPEILAAGIRRYFP